MELSKITCFAANYIKSMRLYYSFVTGVAGWVGVSLVSNELTPRALIALAILFSAWGVNQIINDYLGLPEDRINAPNRPMVSGELNINWALALSGVLIVISTTIAWWFSPISAVFLIIGVLLNVAYEYSNSCQSGFRRHDRSMLLFWSRLHE
jgi:geranylgeranylglycerol-phosphate geranylgeranyltransferase